MLACFYSDAIPDTGGRVALDERETHHAVGSRRLRVGDTIRLLDGRGVLAEGVIDTVSRRQVVVAIRARQRWDPVSPQITVACALPKGERRRVLLDMLTQLAVARVVPLVCGRSIGKPEAVNVERWRRICLEACKQSQNPFLPEIDDAVTPGQAVERFLGQDFDTLFADRSGAELGSRAVGNKVALLVGPEGGFTLDEVEVMTRTGATPVRLGPHVLRIETAAVAAVSAIRFRHGSS